MCLSSPKAPAPPPPTVPIKQAPPKMSLEDEQKRRSAAIVKRAPSLFQTLGDKSLLG